MEPPPAPDLERVRLTPSETALLVLDIQYGNCNQDRRPRCLETLPGIRHLLTEARANGLLVVYSLTRNADRSDIREEVAPLVEEKVVRSSVDKFQGTKLGRILDEEKINTVIVAGTSAQGAVLHTATRAALRGLRVIVPVDCISSGDLYPEQYTVWHLTNAPGSRRHVVLTRSDQVSI